MAQILSAPHFNVILKEIGNLKILIDINLFTIKGDPISDMRKLLVCAYIHLLEIVAGLI